MQRAVHITAPARPRLPLTRLSPTSSITASSFNTRSSLSAHQDYGSGTGDPVGENPLAQGPNPSAGKEHPGPPPPTMAKDASSAKPQPKLHSQPQPHSEHDDQVKKHNEEAAARPEKSHAPSDDKVEKDYWKRGEGNP